LRTVNSFVNGIGKRQSPGSFTDFKESISESEANKSRSPTVPKSSLTYLTPAISSSYCRFETHIFVPKMKKFFARLYTSVFAAFLQMVTEERAECI
jgi:hypothetical protein